MIGRLDPSHKEAVIVGAGISGLLIGYQLKKLGYRIEIHEASDRSGGLIRTRITENGMVESAAHSLLVNSTVQSLFDELQVPLIPVNEKSRARYIVREGKLRRFPLSFSEAFRTANQFFKKPNAQFDSENGSLTDWCEAHLGKPACEYLLSPFITGIFACSPSELNAKLAFPKLVSDTPISLFQHMRRGPKRSPAKMMAPKFGMQSLVDALAEKLKNEIKLNSKINSIPQSPNVIFALPAHALATLIQEDDASSSSALKNIVYSPLVTVTTFFSSQSFSGSPPKGVGVLIPRSEMIRALGVLYNSSSFENRAITPDRISLTFMFGGTTDPKALQLRDEEIKLEIERASKALFGVTDSPQAFFVHRWPSAIPIYSDDLKTAHSSLRNGLCSNIGRVVYSNYSGQVSIRGLIESICLLS